MNYIEDHLQPGETIVYQIQRSRKWYHLALTIFLDLLAVFATWYMLRFLERIFLQNYIRSGSLFGSNEFIVGNLVLGLLPFLMLAALVQDFIFSFFIELALTNQRVLGRVPGLLWTKNLVIPLAEIDSITTKARYLCILRKDNQPAVFISGLSDQHGFARAFERLLHWGWNERTVPVPSRASIDLPR